MIRKIIDRISITITVTLFSLGILFTILGTISRPLNFIPTLTWASELTTFLIVISIFLVVGVGVRKGIQISFPLFLEKLPFVWKHVFDIFNNILVISFFSIMGYYGVIMAQSNATQLSPVLQIPMEYPFWALPIGSFLIVIELILIIIEDIFKLTIKN